ncbi:MAG TPA: mechanosensitive ion channel family protein [Casimicrobiaceae bacterium]|jgi:small-conductance mechanosensitive channel
MDLIEFIGSYLHSWIGVALAAFVAVAAALVAHAIGVPVLRRVTRSSVLLSALVDRAVGPMRLILALLALQLVWEAAVSADLALLPAATTVTALLLIGALTWLVLRAVAAVAEVVIKLHPSNVSDNLEARRVQTQTRVLSRTAMFFVLLIGLGAALMTFPNVRQIGASLLASAGVAGLVAGIAARPVLGNLIAGLQIALTQPLRLDDVVIIEGEWGRIEEITANYVVVKIWDERRLIVPLQWVIEHPFQNWTRRESQLLGSVFLWLDYRTPLAPLRAELERVCASAPEWDQRVALLQVVDSTDRAMQVRALVSSADAARAWDLRCRVREALIAFLQQETPDALPRLRIEMESVEKRGASEAQRGAMPGPGRGDSTSIREPTHAGLHAPKPSRTSEDVSD